VIGLKKSGENLEQQFGKSVEGFGQPLFAVGGAPAH
jgi:hypothetical protein